jgi:outer membrane protein assembly factor BamA
VRFGKLKLFLPVICGFFFACNSVRKIPEGEKLLVKNKIVIDTNTISTENLERYLKQKPNRKFLGIYRFHLNVYNLGLSENDSKFKKWLREIGEEPVIHDSEMVERSKSQLELYMKKNGFFYATVSDSLEFKKKKAKVTYYIKSGNAYTIRNIHYDTKDTGFIQLMNFCGKTSLLKTGERYNEETFEKERERITTEFKDRGYYFFNRNYITFQIDSSLGTNQVDVFLYINRINENTDPSLTGGATIKDHQSYKIRNIYVHTDFNPNDPNQKAPGDTTFYDGYYILSAGKFRNIKDNALVRSLFIKSGDRYLQRDLDYTYKRLQELNIFKFINLSFKEVEHDSLQNDFLLDLNIQLTPLEKMDFTVETEATNTGSNIGLAGSFGYRNKNIFRGAEVLEIKLRGALEALPNTGSSDETNNFLVFNTYEIGPEANLSFKKFLVPGFIERKTSRYANPKTNFNLGYNYQSSPDYTRSITNFGFSYNWFPTRKQRIGFHLFDFNSVVVNLTPEFEQELADLQDPALSYAYETHIITSSRVTWSTTSKKSEKSTDFIFFRGTFEIAYKIMDEKFNPSQYFKFDYDLIHTHRVNPYLNFISRLNMGIGVPYDKSLALPFEKSFFAGGANSMRAWYARTLGPGSYQKTIDIEQSGDLKFETNFEYRSDLFQFSNGMKMEVGAFTDIGNIWTLNEDVSRPGGNFVASNFFSELGIGAGLGLRFNFTFFVLRLDGAVKLRDPALVEDERWVYQHQKFVIGDITLNLGVGYPF